MQPHSQKLCMSNPLDIKRVTPLTAHATDAVQPAYGLRADVPHRLRNVLSLADFEPLAQGHLPRPLYGYIAGSAEDSRSFSANRESFSRIQLIPRVLINVAQRSQQIELFGKKYASPFGIAPVGISAISAYRGDIVLAQSAQEAGIPAIMSGSSLIPMETVYEAAPDTWFQAYLPGDQEKRDALIHRIRTTGFATLVITVDIPVWANRENNVRTGFSLPLRPSLRLAWDGMTRPRWLCGTFLRTLVKHGMPHFENSFATRGAPMVSVSALRDTTGRDHLCWEDIARIREQWPGHLILKGILSPQDALQARSLGIDGIIVSNHGGRQLDGAVDPLSMLPEVCAAAGQDVTVMMDGGIRRGTDVLKAIALGARCVFLGRPFMFAAAVAGAQGVKHATQLLHDEIDRDMAMLGTCSVQEVTTSCIRQSP